MEETAVRDARAHAEAAPRSPSVGREVEELHQVGQRLDRAIERMRLRLEPVLRPAWETTEPDSESTDCPLASQISNCNAQLRRLIIELEALEERVDL